VPVPGRRRVCNIPKFSLIFHNHTEDSDTEDSDTQDSDPEDSGGLGYGGLRYAGLGYGGLRYAGLGHGGVGRTRIRRTRIHGPAAPAVCDREGGSLEEQICARTRPRPRRASARFGRTAAPRCSASRGAPSTQKRAALSSPVARVRGGRQRAVSPSSKKRRE
jgi:hypothetical protein